MIHPASMGDWAQATFMAALLGSAAMALARSLRWDPEPERVRDRSPHPS
jgi:hypothetical protein